MKNNFSMSTLFPIFLLESSQILIGRHPGHRIKPAHDMFLEQQGIGTPGTFLLCPMDDGQTEITPRRILQVGHEITAVVVDEDLGEFGVEDKFFILAVETKLTFRCQRIEPDQAWKCFNSAHCSLLAKSMYFQRPLRVS